MISKFIRRRCLNHKFLYNYETMTPEQYFINQRDCNNSKISISTSLVPLSGANQGFGSGSGDEVYLTGIPLGQAKEQYKTYDTWTRITTRIHPDLVFVQMDPSPYIARQRFLAHKCALKGVEDYKITDTFLIDPNKPHAWEESVVNLVILDMLANNKVYDELDWTEGLASYSYSNIQDKAITERNTDRFIDAIDRHIVYRKYSPYYLINKILYTALMGKHKVLLGDMPEHLLRQNVGGTLEIQELRDLFKYVLSIVKKAEFPISFRKATLDFLPHVFQTPRDLFMGAMIREAFQASENMTAFVGLHHFYPINAYWQGPPKGISYSEASRIPKRIRGETDEQLIEKQAIMDVMLETYTWAEPYLSNPFPYIVDDITKAKKEDIDAMKKCFFHYYSKYTGFKNQMQKELPNFKDDKIICRLENQATLKLTEYPQAVKLKSQEKQSTTQ